MKKVIILGFYGTDAIQDRIKDEIGPDVDIWTVNDWYRVMPWLEPDKVFQIHPADELEAMAKVIGRYPNYKEEYVSFKNTTYITADYLSFLPAEQQRVFDESLFDKYGTDLFSSTIIYMLVTAVEEQYEDVSMYGVCLMGSEEYASQLPQTRYFMGVMRDMGIKVFNEFEENWSRCYPQTNNIEKLPKLKKPYIFMGKHKRKTEWSQ